MIGIYNYKNVKEITDILKKFYEEHKMDTSIVISFTRRNSEDLGSNQYIRVNTRTHELTYGLLEGVDNASRERGFTYEKVFTLKDLKNGLLDNIYEYGMAERPVPNYRPRRIDKNI